MIYKCLTLNVGHSSFLFSKRWKIIQKNHSNFCCFILSISYIFFAHYFVFRHSANLFNLKSLYCYLENCVWSPFLWQPYEVMYNSWPRPRSNTWQFLRNIHYLLIFIVICFSLIAWASSVGMCRFLSVSVLAFLWTVTFPLKSALHISAHWSNFTEAFRRGITHLSPHKL